MACKGLYLVGLLIALVVNSNVVNCEETVGVAPILDVASLNRGSFPPGFIFGAGSSSYQFEGAASEGGRGPSVWDTFTHKYPEKIKDGSNGDVAIDTYHHYKEDVGIMKDMNLDSYRFSISWSRILPKGKISGGINQEGINYYNNLINEMVANGVQPFVTLFHWDLPQALEDEYGGFLSPLIIKDFRDYAELCFKEFGDRVKYWVTLNEPWSYSQNGYANGRMAPGRCSSWMNPNCTGGDSATEPYLVTHYQLLAHAAAVNVYKAKYQASQKGLIGITLVANWFLPLSDSKFDQKAAERAIDFMYGWFMDPLTSGDYPKSMRSLVGARLPKFTTKQARLLIGSFDFIGLNYYSSTYASDAPHLSNARPSYLTDSLVDAAFERNGKPIGIKIASDWLYVYPRGIRDLLLYTKEKYNNPAIYITENGINEYDDPTLSVEESLLDTFRIDYHYRHLFYLRSAIRHGANVKGYYVWSLFDNFEWSSGYTVRFGMTFVDYKNDLKRYKKLSALWLKNFLKRETRLYVSSERRKIDRSKVKCYNCNKYRHFADQCYSNTSSKDQRSEDAKLAKDDEEEVQALLMVTTKEEECASGEWYLDTGCSTHMTGYRDWFVSLDETIQSKVKFVDDTTMSAAGLGKIMIKRRDGQPSYITDVLYVPGMKSNLLSLGQLLEKGFVMNMEDRMLRIYDANKKLLIKAPLSTNRTFKAGIQLMEHRCLASSVTREE